jgi:hypothetical protein
VRGAVLLKARRGGAAGRGRSRGSGSLALSRRFLGGRGRGIALLLVVHPRSFQLGSLGSPTLVPPHVGLGACLRDEGALAFGDQFLYENRCIRSCDTVRTPYERRTRRTERPPLPKSVRHTVRPYVAPYVARRTDRAPYQVPYATPYEHRTRRTRRTERPTLWQLHYACFMLLS